MILFLLKLAPTIQNVVYSSYYATTLVTLRTMLLHKHTSIIDN